MRGLELTATPHATRVSRPASLSCRTRPFHTFSDVAPTISREYISDMMMEKSPIVSSNTLLSLDKPLHMHAEQWDPHPGQVLQQAIPVQVQQTQSNGALVTDEIRFSIIDSIYLRPGIWDSQREKTIGPSRKELFVEVTGLINQQHRIEPELTPEEVEKQWKNLKDTYMKTRKRVTFNNDGVLIPPKWKFYNSLMFLEELFGNQRGGKRRLDEVAGPSQAADVSVNQTKRLRTDEDSEEDEYMAFCRSLLYPLRDIGYKDRVQFLKVQKSIRDLLHETQMEMLLSHMR